MNGEMGELTFLRELAPRYAIPAPQFLQWPADRKTIQDCLGRWKGAVAKADILASGRGKAGLVEEVDSVSDAVRAMQRLATNGPGTISAQAAKLSASAGNSPHTAMIATLAAIGEVHGGNGREAVALLIDAFANGHAHPG
ncbi:MAG: hypothetical protein ABSF26_20475 [Thermoguttaceae bacterium]